MLLGSVVCRVRRTRGADWLATAFLTSTTTSCCSTRTAQHMGRRTRAVASFGMLTRLPPRWLSSLWETSSDRMRMLCLRLGTCSPRQRMPLAFSIRQAAHLGRQSCRRCSWSPVFHALTRCNPSLMNPAGRPWGRWGLAQRIERAGWRSVIASRRSPSPLWDYCCFATYFGPP